jgi:predicted O-methyltransferase YrrM
MEAIYTRPGDYDLEHEGDDEDIEFYVQLVRTLRPRRVLELASGSGRVTIPLAQLAETLGFDIVGLEIADPMLAAAEDKRATLPVAAQKRLTFVRGMSVPGAASPPLISSLPPARRSPIC